MDTEKRPDDYDTARCGGMGDGGCGREFNECICGEVVAPCSDCEDETNDERFVSMLMEHHGPAMKRARATLRPDVAKRTCAVTHRKEHHETTGRTCAEAVRAAVAWVEARR